MAEAYTHRDTDADATNVLLAIILVVVTLILGFFLFRNGFASFQPTTDTTNQDTRVNVPNTTATSTNQDQDTMPKSGMEGGLNVTGIIYTP